jgi:hypothetical protein
MEFQEQKDSSDAAPRVEPVIRREAKEISIGFNPETGNLDISGRGAGGFKQLNRIAEAIRTHALGGHEMTQVQRREWRLNFFRRTTAPLLDLPEGFTRVCVTEIVFRDDDHATTRASFRADPPEGAYPRLTSLGVTSSRLYGELVARVALVLDVASHDPETPPRRVRIEIAYPGQLHIENATLTEKLRLEDWLDAQAFGRVEKAAGSDDG